MSEPGFEYWGLMAQTWDLFRGDTSFWSDRFFFREAVRRYGEPVLDVGCGTGRLLLDFLADGVEIDGVDNSPPMLDLCREKAALQGLTTQLYQQAMEELDLPRRYQTILVPSSSFQLLIEPALALQAMERFYAHLLPGGVLVMPFMAIWSAGDPVETEWELSREATFPDGSVARRWSRAWYDLDRLLEHSEDRYELLRDGVVVKEELHRRSPATQGYTTAQATKLYANAGFGRLEFYQDFTWEAAQPDDRVICIVGHK